MESHSRYLRQTSWTRPLREYLLGESGIVRADRVLEVGCGTGAALIGVDRLADPGAGRQLSIHGLDIEARALSSARHHAPHAILTRGDAHRLPFADAAFDITFCHFLLMWLSNPPVAIGEMRRVTRTRGHVLALAEPDYTARVDRPAALAQLGQMQRRALETQGADPSIGTRIARLFQEAGLTIVEAGTISPRDARRLSKSEWNAEWAVLREDLSGQTPAPELERLELEVRRSSQRMLYVPTFFVHAQV